MSTYVRKNPTGFFGTVFSGRFTHRLVRESDKRSKVEDTRRFVRPSLTDPNDAVDSVSVVRFLGIVISDTSVNNSDDSPDKRNVRRMQTFSMPLDFS